MGRTDRMGSVLAMACVGVLVACADTPMPSASTVASPTASPHSLIPSEATDVTFIGEVLRDGGWPSNYADWCLTLQARDRHFEIVPPDGWTLERNSETGWFELRDASGAVVVREHHAVTMTGRFIATDGCRETGEVFEVAAVEPAVTGSATLHVEIVGFCCEEGSLNVVRLTEERGETIFQAPVSHGQAIGVPDGEFTLVDYQKPCSANCMMAAYGYAVPCEMPIALKPQDEVTLTVLLGVGHEPCELLLRAGGPTDLVGAIFTSIWDDAEMPYDVAGRCIFIDSYVDAFVPVLPEGWRMTIEEADPPHFLNVVLLDPDGERFADEGDILWFEGRAGPPPPRSTGASEFGCDYGTRFDVTRVVDARAYPP